MNVRMFVMSMVGIVAGGLVALTLTVSAYPFAEVLPDTPYRLKTTHASGLASEFGVVGTVSSLSSDSSKQTAVSKMTDAGFGWSRNEFTYASSIDFTPYDSAVNKMKAGGLNILGLLTYPGSDKTHDDWKNYVQSVVSRYASSVSAWEIMNEADNYLSASDYVTFLQEARDIIRSINSGATIVASGIGSRQQATDFWDGIAAAGGWSYFDVIGLHVYHSGNPEKVNFGGGDLVGELSRVVGDINKNGGGKKIWITEMGYQSNSVGVTDQANWLARSLIMLRSVSKLERTFIYRLYDGGGDSYGLLTSSLSDKEAYGSVKSVISQLGGAGTGTKLTPQAKTTLDGFSAVSGWKTDGSSNTSVTLTSAGGYSGNGMKISYNFSDSSAYALVQKSIAISGTPTALAAWIYGDDTKNVWKFRFKDKNGETFQTDLGSIASGWSYKQFTIGTDTAFVSFGGDGKIDFPISFDSIVIDHQGGANQAEGSVDEIIAISGSADLYAYQFGSTVAYWKASGSDTATLCGASRQFSEDPHYASNVDCSDTPAASGTSSSSSSSSSSKSSSAKKKSTPAPAPAAPKRVADKTKSTIRLDGSAVPADGTSSYKLVITVKDSGGTLIKDQKPSVLMSGGQADIQDLVLVGDEWITSISSKEVGERTASVSAGGVDLGSVKMTFVAVVALPATTPKAVAPPQSPTPSPSKRDYTNLWFSLGALVIVSGGVFLARKYYFHRFGP